MRLSSLGTVARNPRVVVDVFVASAVLLRVLADMRGKPTGELLGGDGLTKAQGAASDVVALPRDVRARAHRWERALRRALKVLPVETTCLGRALALHRLLSRDGVEGSRVCIGVKREEGEFTAHAWVELGPLVLGDSRQAVSAWTPLASARVSS